MTPTPSPPRRGDGAPGLVHGLVPGRVLGLVLGPLLALGVALLPVPARAAEPLPAASVSVACTGYDVLVDNSASAGPAEVLVDLTGAPPQSVVVDGGSTRRVTGPLAEAPATVTVSSGGQVIATASLADDCLDLGGGVQATARLHVGCAMRVRAVLDNRGPAPQRYILRVGDRRRVIAVEARQTRVWKVTGRAGQRVSVHADGHLLDRARVPRAGRCG